MEPQLNIIGFPWQVRDLAAWVEHNLTKALERDFQNGKGNLKGHPTTKEIYNKCNDFFNKVKEE